MKKTATEVRDKIWEKCFYYEGWVDSADADYDRPAYGVAKHPDMRDCLLELKERIVALEEPNG